ncbi:MULTISPECIES: aspartate/glutamate racemase family protein [Pantoea]|jgi:aspartate racemase|uniref:Aspartate/glutamate racemase family protein n=1 Tax=Pantoea brenneri TaxID=472694 RepID=A0A7Y6NFP7_9GAMM|nr:MULTISPECIES: aspartate/glutamate racemase family protein [Pantoea]MBZ6396426.1 aspartate/glutamate racemase family protein [Pantoea sp.]MBZ6439843.1 aspartate/glutamate racemase family protein [Pantoea sp.]MDU4127653.1 aspartate/glutamate racemase family protein [Pantoea sp.]NUY42629.1 aspartate/glutamate racemase family protein [Pantoea brenneri]NUY50254.1 aspartate/glutamate racemase family protein [Pantoea brenneri]
MKVIGLLGGMSWESTALYYRILNQQVKQRLGGLHSAQLVLYSVDFQPIEQLQAAGEWQQAGEMLAAAAQNLERAGAQFIVLCTNTMHKVAPQISAAVSVPLLHIADATGRRIQQAGLRKVGLLATRFTMEQAFYRGRLEQQFNLQVIVPEEEDRALVHQVIYHELCLGTINPASRQRYRQIMQQLVDQGAEAIILGCTEITLLVDDSDASVPLFDTTLIHAEEAVNQALA